MLRDLLMAATGAASMIIVIAIIGMALKARDNAERHRKGVANFMSVEEYEARARRFESDDDREFD